MDYIPVHFNHQHVSLLPVKTYLCRRRRVAGHPLPTVYMLTALILSSYLYKYLQVLIFVINWLTFVILKLACHFLHVLTSGTGTVLAGNSLTCKLL